MRLLLYFFFFFIYLFIDASSVRAGVINMQRCMTGPIGPGGTSRADAVSSKISRDLDFIFLGRAVGQEEYVYQTYKDAEGKEKKHILNKVTYIVLLPLKGGRFLSSYEVVYSKNVEIKMNSFSLVKAKKSNNLSHGQTSISTGICSDEKNPITDYEIITSIVKSKIPYTMMFLLGAFLTFLIVIFVYKRKLNNGRTG